MARTLVSNARPKMLVWCRRTSRQSVEAAAKVARVTEERVKEWEDGISSPSFSQLKRLATLYKRPTCVFYLEQPPTDFTIMRDFRAIPKNANRDFSPKLALAIREARERSQWLSDTLKASGDFPLDFVKTASPKDNPQEVGKRLRLLVGMDLSEQQYCKDPADAFRTWRRKCEDLGVCVFIVHSVDVDEMRGFAIIDDHAPVVAVNSKDCHTAKTFTLLHEMAHILIGEAGVSGIEFSSKLHSSGKAIEKFCNAVAGEALVPASSLLSSFDAYKNDNLIATVKLSKQFHVSEEVIARRLLDLGKVPKNFYQSVRNIGIQRALAAKQVEEPPQREKKIARHRLIKSRLGEHFSKVAIGRFREGEIDGSELSSLLGMKLNHLDALESALFPFRFASGRKSQS